MPIEKAISKSGCRKLRLDDLVLAKYRTDPDGFRAYLPEVAQVLDSKFGPHHLSENPFGLTEHEREHRLESLKSTIEVMDNQKDVRGIAVRGLEHCAVLTKDDSLPQEVDYLTLLRLLRLAIGKAVSAIKASTIFTIQEGKPDITAHHVSLIRGIVLSLNNEMRLVSVTVEPQKLKERRRATRFINAAKGPLGGSTAQMDSRMEGKHHATT